MSTYYNTSVPILVHKLGNLKHIVEAGAKHAADNDIDEAALIGFRLFPDMLPFRSQINIATDICAGMAFRVTGKERLKLDDDANTFEQLIARIQSVTEHLKAQDPADYEGGETREIVINTPFGELNFSGTDYLNHFIFPNVYFHSTTAYNILRHNGVKLGKQDFLGGN